MRLKMMKRIAALALSAAIVGTGADLSALNARAEEPGGQAGEQSGRISQDEVIEPVWIDLGDTVTSGGNGFSLLSADSALPSLKDGNHEKWIDRVDLPGYAVDLYNTLVEASDNDGIDDFLIDDQYFVDTGTGGASMIPVYTCTYDFFQKNQNAISANIRAAYDAYDRDHPEVFWLSGKTIVSGSGTTEEINIYFILYSKNKQFDIRKEDYLSSQSIKDAIAQRERDIVEILQFAQSEDKKTKIEKFNEWLTHHNEYNTNTDLSTMRDSYPAAWECISALAGRSDAVGPVCEGYARAFKVLCDRVGIPCVLVDGNAISSSGDGAHMWNYVEVDGCWYAVDVTWNDPVVSGKSGAVSGRESTDWLFLGAESVVSGMKFLESHPVKNVASEDGLGFTNGPVLNDVSYDEEKQKPVGTVEIKMTDRIIYGEPVEEPEVSCSINSGGNPVIEYKLKDAADSEYSREKPVNAGTYTVRVTFPGNDIYQPAVATTDFTISPKPLSEDMVSGIVPFRYYTNSPIEMDISVMDGQTELTKGVDYTLEYAYDQAVSNGIESDMPTVTVIGRGNYKGTVTQTFEIKYYDGDLGLTQSVTDQGIRIGSGLGYQCSFDVNGIFKTELYYTAQTAQDVTVYVRTPQGYIGRIVFEGLKFVKPQTPVKPAENQSNQGTSAETVPSAPKTGQTVTDAQSKASYRVTKTGSSGTVEYQKPTTKKESVTIPDTVKIAGKSYKVTTVSKNAFKGNTKLKTVVIGKNVTTIGDNAFSKCTKLTKVTITSKTGKIGRKAFYGCNNLKNIVIKSTKLKEKTIGSQAFKGIPAKAVVKVPKSKVKTYRKILCKKGLNKKATVKK